MPKIGTKGGGIKELRDLFSKNSKEPPVFKKPVVKKKNHFRLFFCILIVVVLAANFIFVGKTAASYVIGNVQPISFFGDGKFLILFQNNSELRSSGGFIGSFAVLEMQNFEVKNLTFNTNIYKLDKDFAKTNYETAPAPLKNNLRGRSWALRDSNYDASFPEAASDITHFYEKEAGDKIDGIIAINASMMVDLLKVTGPVTLDKYRVTINSDNFFQETQFQIEKAYFQDPENMLQNEPKTIIKDLYPEIVSRALNQNKMKLGSVLFDELQNKNIQLYFKDASKQDVILAKNWGGAVAAQTDQNYLYVVANNYGGNKSSLSVHQSYEYEIVGREASLAISRIHRGTFDWPNGINESYIRILVPEGSLISSASLNGRDVKGVIDQTVEAGKTSYGILAKVAPGQAEIIKINFELPDGVNKKRLIVQKQPGTIGDELRVIRAGRIVYDGLLQGDLNIE